MDDRPLFAGMRDGATLGPWADEVLAACKRCEALVKQQFRFLNVAVSYPEGIDWHDTGVSQLWRYQLHYFDYVQDLRSDRGRNPGMGSVHAIGRFLD